MLLATIKRIRALSGTAFTGKKRSGNSYLKSDMHLSPLPGQKSRHGSQYAQRKNRLARLRQLLQVKKQASRGSYKTPVRSRKMMFRLAGSAVMTLVLLVFLLAGGGRLVLSHLQSISFFQVSAIVFSGAEAVPEQKLREASGIILHQTSLIGLDCSRVEAALTTVPWIAAAEVSRSWPSTIGISVVENVPVALINGAGPGGTSLQYIDKHGVPFMRVRPGADTDFPVITGLTGIGDPQVRRAALGEALIFLANINGNDPYLPAQSVSEIHLEKDGGMVVYLVEYPFPIFFGRSDTSKKYSRLVQVFKALYKKQKGRDFISRIEYIQMDYLHDKVLVARSE
jgi:cell division protein FtsQ